MTNQQSVWGYKVIQNVGANAGYDKTAFDVQYQSEKNITSSTVDLRDRSVSFFLNGQTSQNSSLMILIPDGLIQPPYLGVLIDGIPARNFSVSYEQGMGVFTASILPQTRQVTIFGTSVFPSSLPQQTLQSILSSVSGSNNTNLRGTETQKINNNTDVGPFQIQYNATGVDILSIQPNPAYEELVISVQVSSPNAMLELQIPRNLLDSKQGNSDIPFIAVVDGIIGKVEEKGSTYTTRTISIQLVPSNQQIGIIGTSLNTSPNNPQPPTPEQNSTPEQKIQPSSYAAMTNSIISATPENFDSDNASSITFKCQAFLALGIYLDAFNYCDKALQLDPSNTMVQKSRDYAYNNVTQEVSVIVQANNSLNKTPTDEPSLATMASSLIRLGKYGDSLVYESKVVQMNPSDTESAENEGVALMHLGRYGDALQAIDNSTLDLIDYPIKIAALYGLERYNETLLYIDEYYKQFNNGQDQYAACLDNFEKALVYEKMGVQNMANDYYQFAASCGDTTEQQELRKSVMYLNYLFDYQKSLEHAEKIPPDSQYYSQASYIKVADYYFMAKQENQENESAPQTMPASINPDKTTNASSIVQIPNWVKNTAGWWGNGQVSDDDFIKALQYLIQNHIMKIPPAQASTHLMQIPPWIRNIADLWSNGKISDDEFVRAMQYLVQIGIIQAES